MKPVSEEGEIVIPYSAAGSVRADGCFRANTDAVAAVDSFRPTSHREIALHVLLSAFQIREYQL